LRIKQIQCGNIYLQGVSFEPSDATISQTIRYSKKMFQVELTLFRGGHLLIIIDF